MLLILNIYSTNYQQTLIVGEYSSLGVKKKLPTKTGKNILRSIM
jgi:hypothetical protein